MYICGEREWLRLNSFQAKTARVKLTCHILMGLQEYGLIIRTRHKGMCIDLFKHALQGAKDKREGTFNCVRDLI